jgi:hypothetical protein
MKHFVSSMARSLADILARARGQRGRPLLNHSQLDRLIAPEIKHDALYELIVQFASDPSVRTVLEIGSSAGGGSTEAFVRGLQQNPSHPQLFCIEVSKVRFDALERTYRPYGFVHCYNRSTVRPDEFPSPQAVDEFYRSHDTALRQYELSRVLGWLEQDVQYVREAGVEAGAIEAIKADHGIDVFDMVLIDGSEFTGEVELRKVYGAHIIFLDDVNSFKNYAARYRLLSDANYELVAENRTLRNGFSVFRRTGAPPS